jgi:hypothetical protein
MLIKSSGKEENAGGPRYGFCARGTHMVGVSEITTGGSTPNAHPRATTCFHATVNGKSCAWHSLNRLSPSESSAPVDTMISEIMIHRGCQNWYRRMLSVVLRGHLPPFHLLCLSLRLCRNRASPSWLPWQYPLTTLTPKRLKCHQLTLRLEQFISSSHFVANDFSRKLTHVHPQPAALHCPCTIFL